MAKKSATKEIKLKDSGVIFNEEEHTYTLGDKQLSGITKMLSDQLFPDEYIGVSEEQLLKAASYGTGVHKILEDYDVELEYCDNQELQDYIEICKDNRLVHEVSEYNVTDGETWSSNIDKVFRTSDNTFSLADLKTYGQMTDGKLQKARWQLSIYAQMFEAQNPKAKVDHLYILHIRNKEKRDGTFDHISNIIEVSRIPSEICKELLDIAAAGGQFKNPYSIPEDVQSLESRIRELIETKNKAEEELSSIKNEILSKMIDMGQKTWATDTMRLTRKYDSIRKSLDQKALSAAHPEINLDDFQKESKVAGTLTITLA